MDKRSNDRQPTQRTFNEHYSAARRTMIIDAHYDEHTDTSGWAVVRMLPGMMECRSGSMPHTTAQRAFLSTLLRELFATPVDSSISVATLSPFPVVLLHACRPWVWRMQDWRENGQLIADADLWAMLLPEIDQRCVTWHTLTPTQLTRLDACLAQRLATIAAQGGMARAVGVPHPFGSHGAEVA